MRHRRYVLGTIAALVALAPVFGSVTVAAEEEKDPPRKIVLHPMPEPRPALKYELLPPFIEIRPGNAAVDYGKVKAEQDPFFSQNGLWDEIVRLMGAPLEELRKEEVRSKWGGIETVLDDLHRGARREQIDWQLPYREGTFYTLLLPEMQGTREFARLVAVQTRLHVANGEYDKAIYNLQSGFALGQHVTESENLVSGLVGLAISHIMANQILDMIQQPDAPNLYWALSRLPHPLISLQRGMDAEQWALELSFPSLRLLEEDRWAQHHWENFLDKALPELEILDVVESNHGHAMITFRTLKLYPTARQFLLDRGYSAEQLDAMQAPQLVMLYSMRNFSEHRDALFRWYHSPYWIAKPKLDEELRRIKETANLEIIPLASGILPAIMPARGAAARMDRNIAVLMTLEAIRMHGAANGGKLPQSLDELDPPAPIDPISGKPFEYELHGDTAILDGPPHLGSYLPIEIQFSSKDSASDK